MSSAGRMLGCFLLAGWLVATSVRLDAIPAAEYQQLRRKLAPQVVTTRDELTRAQFASPTQALEIRGTVTGQMRNSEWQLVQVQLADRTAFALQCAKLEPELGMGSQVRVLVIPDKDHVGTYRLAAAGWESVLAKLDPAPQPATAPSPPAPSPYQPYPSRGGDVRADREVILAYQRAVRSFNPRLSEQQATRIALNIIENSIAWGVDARLVMAVVACESGFRPDATSPKGAMGLGQLMPATARGLGVSNAYDPEQNLAGAIRLISGHLERTGDLALALACYNAGPGAVRKYGGVPPYRETVNYIRRVTDLYFRLAPEMRPGG